MEEIREEKGKVEERGDCELLPKKDEGRKPKCLIIDTVDALYAMCSDHVMQVNGWEKIEDAGQWGAGYTAIRKEWERVFSKLTMEQLTHIWITHEKVTEETINRVKVNRVSMGLSKTGKDIIQNRSDFIFYLGTNEEDEPTLFCKPSAEHEIGRRGEGQLDMSPMKPCYEEFNNRMVKETGMEMSELNPVVSIIGRPKIGKTTFASEFPDAVMIDCENGSKFLKKRFLQHHLCPTWAKFTKVLGEVLKDI